MPTVIRPQPSKVGQSYDRLFTSSKDLLTSVSYQDSYKPVLHSSFADLGAAESPVGVAPHDNGFVHTLLRAWQQDLHLELRPDDVWLAILSQLSFFILSRGEELRPFFVKHEGQKTLEVDMRPHSLGDVNIDHFVERMRDLMVTQLSDPSVAEWMMPRFSTTTQTDISVACMLFMGSMKQYFKYQMDVGCGFPSVTLHGTRDDWELIRQCITRFKTLGDYPELNEFVTCLDCVLVNMIAGFDTPDSPEVHDFWMRAAHAGGTRASGGLVTLSGWLTAFCFWQLDGTRTRGFTDEELSREWSMQNNPEEWARLELSGIGFPVIERAKIPAATVQVDVRVVDGFTEEQTLIIAGMIGMELDSATMSIAKPRPGWWILHKK
ncbi:hypothetical protein G7Z17_g1979 [Cylindrodendrum hubeiense]|uniref:Uncharacterized protein n=1 Tax=Cylindrodendrum hubeiense TaxID=595255 RepID=A0A9P5HDS8_9HYPO|nr:hypothetical protein G7Z17_g1979 [Cylindrodendrum hubeiense]